MNAEMMTRMMASARERTRVFLSEEMQLDLLGHRQSMGNVDVLPLGDMTVVVGIGGEVNLLVAFSFQPALLDVLFDRFTADITVPPAQRERYRKASASEIANIIAGHCTDDLPQAEAALPLSAPVVLAEVRSLLRPSKACFASMTLQTSYGSMEISFIGPAELFDHQLNYVD
jgi:CheY-specific phosphatase CheX